MLRQASSRNQRARGFRLKHAIQMGIVITACIWLLYQVKHSHEKKRAYAAKNSKFTSKAIENQEDFFKFGRKDLTRSKEAGTVAEIRKEDESEEVPEEEEDPEIKQEELEMDQIDEQDQQDADDDSDHGIDSAEEEDKEGQMEEADIFESQDHEGGTLAREENYKRDDISSAVVHVANTTESEIVTGDARSMDEEQIVDGSKGENGTTDGSVNNLSDFAKENNNMPNADLANNGTAAVSKESETRVSNSDNATVSNSTIARENIETDLLTNSTQQMNATDEFNNQINPSANSTASVSENQTERQNNATAVEPPAEVQRSNYTLTLDSPHRNTTASNTLNGAEKSNSTVPYSEEHSISSSTNGNGDAGTGETGVLSPPVMKDELSILPDIQKGAAIVDEVTAE